MIQLLSALLPRTVEIPSPRESALAPRFYHLIAQNDFYPIFQLYLKSAQVERQELLEIIAKSDRFYAFTEYLVARPNIYLSHFFLAVMHAYKAQQAKPKNSHKKQLSGELSYMIYNAQYAYELFIKALQNSQQDVLIYAHLLDNLQLLNETDATIQRYYAHALQWDKKCFYVHQAMTNLMRNNHPQGVEKAFLLAKELTKKSSMGSANHQLIARAHIQQWVLLGKHKKSRQQRHYFKQAAIHEEICDAYALFIHKRTRNSCSQLASQAFMFCFYLMGDKERLTDELKFNQGYINFYNEPWSLLSLSKLRYNLLMRQCRLLRNDRLDDHNTKRIKKVSSLTC